MKRMPHFLTHWKRCGHKKFFYRRANIALLVIVIICSTNWTYASPNFSNASLEENKGSTLSTMQQIITGKVIAEDGSPLPGSTISIQGTTTGVITDLDGNFSLNLPESATSIVISYVGYITQTIAYSGQTEINITLLVDRTNLEEVVVVGYGTQKKSVITGSIARVNAEELEKSKDLRVEQALQGRTAGVVVMNNSGQPGDNLTITIRGTGTNGDPDPLFIIDGLPMEKEGLDYLSSSDIESIEVLKDASSTAIYGTRGANGVVLITTKQGKKGQKGIVTYDGYYGIQNPWRKQDLLNSQQYIEIMNEASINDGGDPLWSQSELDTMHWDTDWQDEMYYENAPKQSHSFSFTGGGDNSTYSSSLNYYSQDGIVAKGKSKFERLTYRLNTTHSFEKLTIGSNLNFVLIKKSGIDGNTQYGTGINQALNMQPIVPVIYDDGTFATPGDFGVGIQEITNPVALLHYINKKSNTNKVLGNVFAEYEIIKGLKFKSNFGAEYASVKNTEYVPVYFIDTSHKNNDSTNSDFVTKEIHDYIHWNWDNTLTYQFNISKNNFVLMAGMTRFKEWDEGIWAKRYDPIFDDLDHAYLDNALELQAEANNGITEHTLSSIFGRVNYNYNEKYLAEALIRKDGSSRFGSANKYGYFPAFSIGWVLSKESFFPENNIMNFAKIRSSWGQNGNENIGNFRYTSIMQKGLYYSFGTDKTLYNGIQPDFYPNSSIKWETSQQFDLGFDLGFLANQIYLTFDYYDKRTKDWLIDAPAMLIIGNSGPVVNGGEVENSGIEFELSYKNNLTRDLFLGVSVVGSTNRSKVLSINNENGAFTGGEGIKGQGDVLRAAEGLPLGYFWGYETEGIFQSQEDLDAYPYQGNAKLGDLKFKDQNGDKILTDSDKVVLGNPNPKFICGLNINLEWKGLDLYMFWYSAFGHQIWMVNRRNDMKYTNFSTEVLDRWTPENTNTDIPRVTISDPGRSWIEPSDFFVENADYLRLKTLTLGYTIPKKITEYVKLNKVRFYITAENLITFTKYPGMEVEVGGGPLGLGIDHGTYPSSKTFIGGVSIIF